MPFPGSPFPGHFLLQTPSWEAPLPPKPGSPLFWQISRISSFIEGPFCGRTRPPPPRHSGAVRGCRLGRPPVLQSGVAASCAVGGGRRSGAVWGWLPVVQIGVTASCAVCGGCQLCGWGGCHGSAAWGRPPVVQIGVGASCAVCNVGCGVGASCAVWGRLPQLCGLGVQIGAARQLRSLRWLPVVLFRGGRQWRRVGWPPVLGRASCADWGGRQLCRK